MKFFRKLISGFLGIVITSGLTISSTSAFYQWPAYANSESTTDDFYKAIRDNNTAKLIPIIERNAKYYTELKDKDGNNAVMYAAHYGSYAVLNLLLERYNVNPDLQNHYGVTASMIAAISGQCPCMYLLFQKGAKPDIQDKDKNTVLHYATQSGNVCYGMIYWPVYYGAKTDLQNNFGHTALMTAINSKHFELAKYLLDSAFYLMHPVDSWFVNRKLIPNLEACEKSTDHNALEMACESAPTEIIELILMHSGCTEQALGNHINRALYFAAKQGRSDVVRLLLKRGADPHVTFREDDGIDYCALTIAARKNYADVVSVLLQSKKVNDLELGQALGFCASYNPPVIKNMITEYRTESYSCVIM